MEPQNCALRICSHEEKLSLPFRVSTERAPLRIDVTGLSDVIAGQAINLTCTVNRGPDTSETPDVQWRGPGLNLLLSGRGGIMVDDTTMVNSTFIRTLRFTPARTSHGGLYTCQAMADSVTVTKAINLTVQSKCRVRMLVD